MSSTKLGCNRSEGEEEGEGEVVGEVMVDLVELVSEVCNTLNYTLVVL